MWSALNCSPTSEPDYTERYSRKVFVGGLPPDIDEGVFELAIKSLPEEFCV